MNTCIVHGPTGTLLLDWTHLSLIDDSFRGLKPATPSVMSGLWEINQVYLLINSKKMNIYFSLSRS